MVPKVGRRVTAAEFREAWFLERAEEMAQKLKVNRKLWEFCAIAQVYLDTKGDEGGMEALGFGVGREPLPAWLASKGAEVLATDRPDPEYWRPDQHARGFDELANPGICNRGDFEDLVKYRAIDMRAIPEDLAGQFDFTWSSSCFEHLGSIKAGLDFFCEQMRCLRPGGIAAHTTEYNYLSNYITLEAHNLVAFRQMDLEELRCRLAAQGDVLWPVDLLGGREEADSFVDEEPYQEEPHLNLRLAGHTFTSILLIAQRGL